MLRTLLIPLACASTPLSALPEGFRIQDFAGPPNVEYPTAITVAPNGDVFVSSDKNGSLGKNENMGKVVRCRDTDGDGKADQFVDFVPSVNSPRGSHIVGDTLYLIHPPYLSSFRDADGDGKAEEKKVLVTGFGGGIEHPRGADHTTNGVRMGIDGWLYVSVGDFGMANAKGADGTTYTLHGGGVVRVRPDGSEMEPYALMVRNICDTAISPTLDLFSRDNTNDGKGWNTRFHHYTALGDHGYPRLYKNFAEEAIAPLADYGGGSGTGALWLSEPGFPGGFGEMLYSCDWTTGNILCHPHRRTGASFTVDQKVFHALPRAIDIDVDGFSRLYTADWRGGSYNYAGPNKPVGMVQMVKPVNETGKARYQDVTQAEDKQLVTLLGSPSHVQRFAAQREMLKRGRKPVFQEGLLALAKDASRAEGVRTAAIFTFKQLLGADANKPLLSLWNDHAVREYVLRAATDRKGQLTDAASAIYQKSLSDSNQRVVLQALVGLQRLGAASSSTAILTASRSWKEEGVSPRLMHTASAVLASLADVPSLLQSASENTTRPLALSALRKLHRKDVVDGLAKLLETSKDTQTRYEVLTALARLHYQENPWDLKSWWQTRPDDRGPYFETVEWDQSARIRGILEKEFASLTGDQKQKYVGMLALNRLPVSELKLDGLDPVMAALGNSSPEEKEISILADAASDPKRPFSQRAECYRALSRAKANRKQLGPQIRVLAVWIDEKGMAPEATQHIDDFVNHPDRAQEIDLLRQAAATSGDAVSRIAWRSLLTLMKSPLTKKQLQDKVKQFVAANPMETGFFLALADLKLTGFDTQIDAALKSDNAGVAAAAQQARTVTSGTASGGKRVAELPVAEVAQAAMKGKGHPDTGKRLFVSQGCVACHSIDPKAEQKGPYLGAAGAKFTRDYLIDSILEPNKVVAQGFQTTMITMKDGVSHLGFITGEQDGVVEIRNIAGQVTRVPRADIRSENHLPQSMMPPGLANPLTVEDFISLIEYMVSLRAVGG